MQSSRNRLVRVFGRFDVPEDSGDFDVSPDEAIPALPMSRQTFSLASRAEIEISASSDGAFRQTFSTLERRASTALPPRLRSLDLWREVVRDRLPALEERGAALWDCARL